MRDNKGDIMEIINKVKEKDACLAEKLEKYFKEALEMFGGFKIKCLLCGKSSKMGRWIFIQEAEMAYEHLDDEPRRKDLEIEMCRIVCPDCGGEIGLYRHPQKNTILDSIELFGEENLFQKIVKRNRLRF